VQELAASLRKKSKSFLQLLKFLESVENSTTLVRRGRHRKIHYLYTENYLSLIFRKINDFVLRFILDHKSVDFTILVVILPFHIVNFTVSLLILRFHC
jgi:hypothetical protein